MSGPDVNLILRSTRVVTPEGTRPAGGAGAGGAVVRGQTDDTRAPPGAPRAHPAPGRRERARGALQAVDLGLADLTGEEEVVR
ncbi:hypothetical protein ACFWIP_39585, partial [Streptomyces anulatus]